VLAGGAGDEPGGDAGRPKVSELAGVPATITADGVVRITWPRTDVVVRVDGAAVKPFAGLTTGAAFAPSASGARAGGRSSCSRMKWMRPSMPHWQGPAGDGVAQLLSA
jgi:hypothetical protein